MTGSSPHRATYLEVDDGSIGLAISAGRKWQPAAHLAG